MMSGCNEAWCEVKKDYYEWNSVLMKLVQSLSLKLTAALLWTNELQQRRNAPCWWSVCADQLFVSCGAWRRFYLHEFGGDQPEASMLKALDDLATQSSLDAIGLHGNEGTLHVCLGGCTGNRKWSVSPQETRWVLWWAFVWQHTVCPQTKPYRNILYIL